MNDTFALIAKYSRHKKTKELYRKLDRTIVPKNTTYTDIVILSAVVELLIDMRVVMDRKDDGTICPKCSSANLTELFQAMRAVFELKLENIQQSKCCK